MSVALNDADKGTDVAAGGMGDMPMAGMAMGAHREHEAMYAHAVQGMQSVSFSSSAADAQDQNAPFHVMAGGAGVLQDFACGYCQLLAYFPFLNVSFIPLVWLMLCLSGAPPRDMMPVYPVTFFPGLAQPRAPPVY